MALKLDALEIIAPYLKNSNVLSLGYPDLLVTKQELDGLFNVNTTTFTNAGHWHGIENQLPETVEFFKSLNSTFDCVDIYSETGFEKVVDLNYPHDLGSYDLVIDSGTIEHCFNIGQAMINAANAVKVGGRILHTPPMTMINHGFYNICPTLMRDFYGQNGWEIETLIAKNASGEVEIKEVGRFPAPPEVSIYCLVKRTNGNELKYPIQHKYLVKKR